MPLLTCFSLIESLKITLMLENIDAKIKVYCCPPVETTKLHSHSCMRTRVPCFRQLFLGFEFFPHWETVTTSSIIFGPLGWAAFGSGVRLALLFLRAAAVAHQHPSSSRHVAYSQQQWLVIQYSPLSASHGVEIKRTNFLRMSELPTVRYFRRLGCFRCKQPFVTRN